MSDAGNLRGVARPSPHLRAALRLLHPDAHAITLEVAMDEARAVDALAKVLDAGLSRSVEEGGKLNLHTLAAHVLRAARETPPMNQSKVDKRAPAAGATARGADRRPGVC